MEFLLNPCGMIRSRTWTPPLPPLNISTSFTSTSTSSHHPHLPYSNPPRPLLHLKPLYNNQRYSSTHATPFASTLIRLFKFCSYYLAPSHSFTRNHHQITKPKKNKTYSRRDSLVVTDPTTSLPINSLCMAERTGCPVVCCLWPYVKEIPLSNFLFLRKTLTETHANGSLDRHKPTLSIEDCVFDCVLF